MEFGLMTLEMFRIWGCMISAVLILLLIKYLKEKDDKNQYFPEHREEGGFMKVWNSKYDIDHEELEAEISVLANELGLLNHEVINVLEDLKSQHEDWEVDRLLDEVRKQYMTD